MNKIVAAIVKCIMCEKNNYSENVKHMIIFNADSLQGICSDCVALCTKIIAEKTNPTQTDKGGEK